MKKTLLNIILIIAALIIIIPSAVIIIYRLPINKAGIIKRQIVFKMVDLRIFQPAGSFRGFYLEPFFGNEELEVIGENNTGREYYYVSKADFDKCWKDSPLELGDKGKTLEVTLEVQKLVFGGYTPAKIIKIEKIKGKPYIVK